MGFARGGLSKNTNKGSEKLPQEVVKEVVKTIIEIKETIPTGKEFELKINKVTKVLLNNDCLDDFQIKENKISFPFNLEFGDIIIIE